MHNGPILGGAVVILIILAALVFLLKPAGQGDDAPGRDSPHAIDQSQ